MLALKSVLPFALLALASFTYAQDINAIRCQNGQAAQAADQAKASISASSACNTGDVACVGDKFGQCVGSKFVTTACAGGLKCQVLPLVNKAGTSVACTSDTDKSARISASLASCNGNAGGKQAAGQGKQPTKAPAKPAAAPAPAPAAGGAASGPNGAGNKKATQFITGPCSSDADCASGCCGFRTGKCAGPVIAQERDGGCGFGDAQPNDRAARIFRGQSPAPAPAAPAAPAPAKPQKQAPPPQQAPATGGAVTKKGTQFITGKCASDSDCASQCCGFKSGKCAGPVIAQERDGGCGFGDAQPNDRAARIFRGQA
ncbi:uncharacterized protein EV422DRAFT_620219 [Fimicolochytrium jonesii]|uniref:uncharacterized protein n=1 Tax=Fimicolochytrium jonesii TaxID=1396493 RepID=UPI0022FE8738|nr:uncharacterized protein EV422DRAFT_620219 [Fimicolochytrium jonesii]KAI8820798.1 hypothetical protein EV422DRAFT_620219 [Fimicolochytrium jonesii]